ncbi:MAG: outer membrane protein assembly factor BamB [Verrucomicrobiales bacterium]|jgi:outer membrane protein assembly factor BamB
MKQNRRPALAHATSENANNRPLFRFFFLWILLIFIAPDGLRSSPHDWPRWRGNAGTGDWNSAQFPGHIDETKTEVLWRQRINGGYSGVTTADGRVFTMDYAKSPDEKERILCFDADSGKLIWEHSYSVGYKGLDYGSGPRASVTIDGAYAYILGAVGHAFCIDAATGKVVWQLDTVAKLDAQTPRWGFAASPVIWNDLVILHVAAQPAGCYIALKKMTGKEVWRSIDDPAGYCTPFPIQRNGIEQFVCWTPEHIHGISPADGSVQWSIPYKVKYGVSIASPLFVDGIALVCGYWHGSRAIQLSENLDSAELLWKDEVNISGLMSQPLYKDGHVYLIDKENGLLCFELATGKVKWNDDHQLTPADQNPQATLVWADKTRDLICVLNANGELIIAHCTAKGMKEKSRMQLIGKTWAHPAYSGNRIYARSDREIVAVRLWPDS